MAVSAAAVTAKLVALTLSDRNGRTVVFSVIAALVTPVILIATMIMCTLSGTVDHNISAVQLSFHGGYLSSKVPAEYRMYAGLELLAQSSVDVIYLVDSFGAFYPEQIERLSDKYLNIAAKYNKKVGIHAHNNQQLAFANTIEALSRGVSYLDATVSGMGRGAGNCYMELLLSFLRNPRYNKLAVMSFVEKHMLKLKEEGAVWGYDIPYLLTGTLNSHPSSAINFIKENRTDYAMFYQELIDNTL